MGKGGGKGLEGGKKTLFSTIACLVWYFFIFLFNLFSFIFVGRERKETEKKKSIQLPKVGVGERDPPPSPFFVLFTLDIISPVLKSLPMSDAEARIIY